MLRIRKRQAGLGFLAVDWRVFLPSVPRSKGLKVHEGETGAMQKIHWIRILPLREEVQIRARVPRAEEEQLNEF